ncbi:MAG: beta-glucosidase BglX [Chitinophagaceae bacterium]|nr:beta-glucosidase BglX [Chitinophagaceae bacterium]
MLKRTVLLSFLFAVTASYGQSARNNAMDQYINALMQKMTLEEKIGQLNLLIPGGSPTTGSVVSSNVEAKIKQGNVGGLFGVIGADKIRQAQDIAVKQSRLKIPLIFGSDVIHGHKTTFPIPLGLSCSWDTALIRRTATIAAREGAADGLSWAFSPMVDIARDPRWGRIAEGAGEDAFLGSQVARAMVLGYQGNDLRNPSSLMACVKHFALYGAAEAGRDYNTVDMSRVRMYNEYLPPYKAAVEAGTGSVMSSFNTIDQIPATGNKWLLTDLLRKEWGFNGFVVSDYTSLNEMGSHGMGDLATISALALNAGLDMDMVGEGFLTTLKKSLQEGKVTQQAIDQACRRILEAKYKLGLFSDPYRGISASRAAEILTPENRMAAREAAAHSFVLLKNENQLLPLKKSGTIAVIGPLADSKRNMLGTWSVSGDWQQSVSVIEGIRTVVGNKATILYAKGANISDDRNFVRRVNMLGMEVDTTEKRSADEMLNEAVQVAQEADVVIAAVGEAADMSGESASRAMINIPESQQNLLKAIAKTGKKIVLVLFNGRPLTLNWEAQNIPAILDVWFGGTEAGNAIADVVFGNYNPSGKLTATFPYSVGQIPVYYNHLNTGRPFAVGDWPKFKSDYLDIPNEPLYPFGYGLSYTNFTYSKPALDRTSIGANDKLRVSVNVTNSGNYDGEETVQLYTRQMVGSIARPVKELKGFQKIWLRKGESREVVFTLSVNDLKFYNKDLHWVYEPGEFKVFVGTDSGHTGEAGFTVTK